MSSSTHSNNVLANYFSLLANLLPPIQGHNSNAQTGITLPYSSSLITGTLGVLTAAVPIRRESFLLGNSGTMTPHHPFPPLVFPGDQTDATRRGEESTYRSHDGIHHQCPHCAYRSHRRFNVREHLQTHNPTRTRNYQCSRCPSAFFRRFDLNRHFNSVHRNKRYPCQSCHKSFSRRSTLRRHESEHHNVREDYD